MKKAFLLFSLFSYSLFAKPAENSISIETLHLFEYKDTIRHIANFTYDLDKLRLLLEFHMLSEELIEPFIESFKKSFQTNLTILLSELPYVLEQNRDEFASVSLFQDHAFNTHKDFKNFDEDSKELYVHLQKTLLIIKRLDTSISIKSSLNKPPRLYTKQLVEIIYMIELFTNEMEKIKDKLIIDKRMTSPSNSLKENESPPSN